MRRVARMIIRWPTHTHTVISAADFASIISEEMSSKSDRIGHTDCHGQLLGMAARAQAS